jgi:ABC-type Zn uptake system ZnuABC Zn-binding protein ZnuA
MNFGSSKRLVPVGLSVGLAVSAVWGLAGRGLEAEAAGPRVVATTTIVADLVRQVAGDAVEVDGARRRSAFL